MTQVITKPAPTLQAPAGFNYFDHDPITGVHTWFRITDTGETEVCTSHDPTPILEANKAQQYDAKGSFMGNDRFVKVASIPMTLIQKWKNEEGWDAADPAHRDKLVAKLNSNEYQALRIAGFAL